jgi:DNA adenine methylase
MKTFIRWSGNKTKHLRHILKYIPNSYRTYIEPFVGSGALFLNVLPQKWIINDINKDLMNCWKTVQNKPKSISNHCKKLKQELVKRKIDEKIKYCKSRTSNIENMKYNCDRAATYILMKQCAYMGKIFMNNKLYFSGLDLNIYKNKDHDFTSQVMKNIESVSNFLNLTEGKMYEKDYKTILNKAKPGDFVFLDPPYEEEHDYFLNYNDNKIEEQIEKDFLDKLYNELQHLDKKKVFWMMTQANTSKVKSMFKEYKIVHYKVYRGMRKSYTTELLIMNYE